MIKFYGESIEPDCEIEIRVSKDNSGDVRILFNDITVGWFESNSGAFYLANLSDDEAREIGGLLGIPLLRTTVNNPHSGDDREEEITHIKVGFDTVYDTWLEHIEDTHKMDIDELYD